MKFTLTVPELDASKFKWSKADTTDSRTIGSAMASDLSLRCGQMPYKQCFNDAADLGRVLVNRAKGTSMPFVLESENVNDGDLQSWIFNNCSRQNPIKLVIFND